MTADKIAEIVREYLATNGQELTTSEGGDIDLCLDAINDAKNFCQLKRDWNYLKVHEQSLTVPVEGLDITAEGLKKLLTVYSTTESGEKSYAVDFTRERQVNKTFKDLSTDSLKVYQVGKKIYVAGASGDVDLVVEAFEWLPLYDDSVQEDFFTDYGGTFLKFYAIHQLQTYKKEDQRQYITNAMVERHYKALEDFDGQLDTEEDSLDLA